MLYRVFVIPFLFVIIILVLHFLDIFIFQRLIPCLPPLNGLVLFFHQNFIIFIWDGKLGGLVPIYEK